MSNAKAIPHQIPARVLEQLDRAEKGRRQSKRRNDSLVWFLRIGFLVGFVALWEFSARTGLIEELFFSSPSKIIAFLEVNISSGEVFPHLIVTMREMCVAFVLGSVLGVGFGLLRISFPTLQKVTDPFLTFLNALPRVALAPMFVIWFGLGEPSKVALAVSLIFFIMMINTEAGAKGIEGEYFTVMKAMGATHRDMFRLVLLPGSIAAVFGGLRLAVVYSLTGVVFGEMLAGRAGLGQQIQYYASTFNTAGVFGTIIVLAIVAMLINALIVMVESRLLFWRKEAGARASVS